MCLLDPFGSFQRDFKRVQQPMAGSAAADRFADGRHGDFDRDRVGVPEPMEVGGFRPKVSKVLTRIHPNPHVFLRFFAVFLLCV